MKELQSILDAWSAIETSGGSATLATVVDVRGSAYRRPGARMLITEDGRTVGGVSAGCLESDVIERARLVLFTGRPVLAEYDTTRDDDLIFGTGMGCHGVVRVLIERLSPGPGTAWLGAVRRLLRGRLRGALATVYAAGSDAAGSEPAGSGSAAEVGARLLLAGDGAVFGDLGDPALTAAVLDDARLVLGSGHSATKTYAPGAGVADPAGAGRPPARAETAGAPRALGPRVLIEALRPPLPLVIFGAGHDALPLVRLGKEVGWHVTVADGRPAWATGERFPSADALVVTRPESIAGRVALDGDTAAVVMTHNYAHDLNLLRSLLQSPARYVGLLGSRARARRLLDDLAAEGFGDEAARSPRRLFAPVGLDLGAQTPEEIALAVVAEIQAVFRGRPGGPLTIMSP